MPPAAPRARPPSRPTSTAPLSDSSTGDDLGCLGRGYRAAEFPCDSVLRERHPEPSQRCDEANLVIGTARSSKSDANDRGFAEPTTANLCDPPQRYRFQSSARIYQHLLAVQPDVSGGSIVEECNHADCA